MDHEFFVSGLFLVSLDKVNEEASFDTRVPTLFTQLKEVQDFFFYLFLILTIYIYREHRP